MSKFQCTENKQDFVEVVRDKNDKLALTIGDNHSVSVAFLAPSDAPALALAILEAAGYDASQDRVSNIGHAMHWLNLEIELTERATAKAKEQAELEAEALELHNAFWAGLEGKQLDSWDDERGNVKNSWVSAARRAREMRAEK